jgi:pimeloyl-ACP methyl ester carboxylesterase
VRGILIVLLLLGGTYIAICVLAFLFQKRLTFFPERRLEMTPARAGLEFEDVFFEAEDGVRLHGWFVPAASERGTVLFFHGNAGNISHRVDTLRLLHDLRLSILAFDYRGYGRSSGSISEAGTRADARAAWRYLVQERGVAPQSTLLFGRSLGAAVAIELATKVQPAGVIAESAFTSIADMATHAYPWLPVRWLLRMQFDSREHVRNLRVPKLFVHSRDDDIVPFDMGWRLYAAAADPKWFLEIQGSHNEGWLLSREYAEGWRRFLDAAEVGL